ncbi:MAG TPA: hypothetical protein VFL83_08295 [Anaeromyxobacter sp.]|nr:hypothetical protein [Anaeromyxobacter sp.]
MLDPSVSLTPPPEPAFCPSCGLRHTRRSDWLCPRCGMPVESEPRRTVARPAPRGEEGFPLGSRVAGAVLLAGAAALGAGLARHPPSAHRWPLLAGAVLLAVLGAGALLKLSWARWAAVGAGLLAAVIAAEDLLRERLPDLVGDPVPPAIRASLRSALHPLHPWTILLVLAFVAGALLLLLGRPRRARIAAGAVLASPLVVLLVIRALAR